MAGNLCKCTSISSFLFDGIAALTQRRGYAAAATTAEAVRQSCKEEEKATGISAFTGGERVARSDANKDSAGTSWIPDPVTGYYRPVNEVAEVDAADLRKTHC